MEYREKFYLAQKCINEIDDFLEYRWSQYEAEDIRHIIMGMVGAYAHDIAQGHPRPCPECLKPLRGDEAGDRHAECL